MFRASRLIMCGLLVATITAPGRAREAVMIASGSAAGTAQAATTGRG